MSKFIKTPIHEATDEEIRDFCEVQQLDVDGAKSRADLLGILGSAWEHDHIPTVPVPEMLPDEAAAMAMQTAHVRVSSQQSLAGGLAAGDPTVKLKIGTTPLPGGNEPVPVGVNGKTIIIQRNMVADVPYRFYLALENAIREDVTQDAKTGDIAVTQVTNYPMQIIAMPSDEEIANWRARTDADVRS